jgi:hypothetical protein
MSMAKTLANLPFESLAFNQNGPHFSDDFIKTIKWEEILPCFPHLPDNIVELLPLLLAQLVHHYHQGYKGLGQDNPLRLSPLWNDPSQIIYRHTLFANLKGALYGDDQIKNTELRDFGSDEWCMQVTSLQNEVAIMEGQNTILDLWGGQRGSSKAHACVERSNYVLSQVTGDSSYSTAMPGRAVAAGGVVPPPRSSQNAPRAVGFSTAAAAGGGGGGVGGGEGGVGLRGRDQGGGGIGDGGGGGGGDRGGGGAFRILVQPDPPFTVPSTLNCRLAFFRMHTKGADKLGMWREKNGAMIDATLDTAARKPQRELFNKAVTVCRMLQGSDSNADIDRIGVDTAWSLCKQKVNGIWFPLFHYNILGDEGSAAVRTVYNFMMGKDTLVTKDRCEKCVQLCLTTAVATNHVSMTQPPILKHMPRVASDDYQGAEDVEATACADKEVDDYQGAEDVRATACTDVELVESAVLNIDDSVECYVCERCVPPHLYRHWSDYTHCVRAHLRLQPRDKHHCFKDQVRTVMAQKSDPTVKTSPYVQIGTPTFKTYSVEEQRIFLRERIIHLGILQVNDRIDIQLVDGQPPRVAVVVSAQLFLLKKSWAVNAVILHANNSGILDDGAIPEPIWVSSILSIHKSNATVGKSPKTRTALSTTTPGLHSSAVKSFTHAATASAAVPQLIPKKLEYETPHAKSVGNAAAASAAPTRRRLPTSLQVPDIKRVRAEATIIESGSHVVVDYQLGTGAHIILRDIAAFGACFRIPHVAVGQLTSPTFSGEPNSFPIFKYNAASFVEEDYGLRFDGIYPLPIQHALEAFGLQESNRCFFLSLGIATNIDPFLLQCLFRTHAHTLELNKIAILQSLGNGDDDLQLDIKFELEEAVRFKQRDVSCDCRALRFFWPIEFDNFRIVVISVDRTTIRQQVFNASPHDHNLSIGTDDAGTGKKTIFLKLQSGHFTGLTLVQGSVTLNIEYSSQWFLHEIDSRWRCPSIKTMLFSEHVKEREYVASAVKGALPSEEEVNTLWLQVTGEKGITFDVDGKWLTGLPPGVCFEDWNQQGSLKSDSWNTARNALVKEFDEENLPLRSSRSKVQSPSRCPQLAHSQITEVPFVFLDVGSESGRGLVKMLHDDRITHAAGIELQPGWFQLCVVLFRRLRTLFIEKGYRLPSITIFQSCLLLTSNPGLAYLYATCSIVLMNNEVFDNAPYFVAHPRGENGLAADDVRNAPLYNSGDVEVRKSLSANAAYTLSTYFQNTTCIAVFKPQFFNDRFGYSIGTKYQIKATWASWAKLHITIKLHKQHITIADGMRLPCASPKYVGRWQEYMQKWSQSLPEAYLIMRQPKYWTKTRQKGRDTTVRGKKAVEVHTSDPSDDETDTRDLEATLPDILELQGCNQHPWCGLNLQCLTSLHPTKMLHQSVLNNYMFLLKSHFPQISFVPQMMDLYQQLLVSDASFDAKKSFCQKYLFKYEQPETRKTIIFAMNPGLHWIAFKVDFHKQYIATMCSLKNTLNTEAKKLKDCISSIVPAARSFQHISVTVPFQKNHVDCGPLCCMFMLFLAQNDISADTCLEYDTLPAAAAMRLRIFSDIAAKKLTILVPTC